jgi:hypothetical protein
LRSLTQYPSGIETPPFAAQGRQTRVRREVGLRRM